ncbi:hypothetical protein Plim_1544 [Planctopirus limnophila DSM 3776]|uniref:Uncharacterized protein n=2 Tax=Planctopirus limnophila TaxID=120 RepID=D5SW92_PLAL2|nr:hypothetical protein Plim_1544 [Planctopirus limnophila DSM 3776]
MTGCQMVKHNTSIHSVSFDWNTYRQVSFWCEERDHLPLRPNRVAMTQWAYNPGGRLPQAWNGTANCPPENMLIGPAGEPFPQNSGTTPIPTPGGIPENRGMPPMPSGSSGPSQQQLRTPQELPAPPGWGGVPESGTRPPSSSPQGLSNPTQPDLLDHSAPPTMNSLPGERPRGEQPFDPLGPTATLAPSGVQKAGYSVEPSQRRVVQKAPASRNWIFTN